MTLAARLAPEPLSRSQALDPLAFELPASLEAHEPPEARGLARDGVRLMVSHLDGDAIEHARFSDLPDFLAPDDVLVVNASATINAALDAWRTTTPSGARELVVLHLSTVVDDGRWVVELRRPTRDGTQPLRDASAGDTLRLRGGATATLIAPYHSAPNANTRLWIASLDCGTSVLEYAAEHGRPIRYAYVPERWPLSDYQTIFGTEPGSAEMPSAGRAFTRAIVERLEQTGVQVASVVLHTGVASLESDELPYPERFRVPAATAALVNDAFHKGGRVIAVGTTVVRALESAAGPRGRVRAMSGWTDLVLTPQRGLRVVDGMLTGFHAPRASHLAMLEAIAGRSHLATAYAAALEQGYLWHEFGDSHLILPGR